jgi:hypothetical protein
VPGSWGEVDSLNTPVDPGPVKATAPGDPAEALDKRTQWILGIITAVAGIVALTHESLTAALASAHRDSALKAAHALLTWPMPVTQPILAGVAAFVLLGIAVQTNGWRQVTARQRRLLLGFAIAAILGVGPMALFCLLTVVVFLLVISFGLMFLLVLLLLLLIAAMRRRLGSRHGENIRTETVLAPPRLSRARRRGQPDPGQGAGG